MLPLIYGAAIFVGSFLLFLIQPLVGKILLPVLGGAPAVWTTCMLFFQAALLAGYLYAEKAIKLLGCQKQSVIHLLLMILAFLSLPLDVRVSDYAMISLQPTSWLLTKLTLSVGFIFFMVAANAPVILRWYSQTGQNDAADPYYLYSISNLGSLVALFSYPFLFEPFFTLMTHKSIWSWLYIFQTVLVLIAATFLWKNSSRFSAKLKLEESFNQDTFPWKMVLRLVIWGFIPCSTMLGVTTHIATDIASLPMLWIFPLGIYLFSFVLAFSRNSSYRDMRWDRQMLPMAALIAIMYFFGLQQNIWFSVPIHLFFLFTVCMHFHAHLANARPVPALLNSYFVWMSVGGIAGGFFNSIIAPIVFNQQFEYIVALSLAVLCSTLLCNTGNNDDFSFWHEMLVFALLLLALATFAWFSEIAFDRLLSSLGIIAALAVFIITHLFYRFKRAAGLLFLIGILLSLWHVNSSERILFTARSFFGIHRITRISTDGIVVDPDLQVEGIKDIFYCLSHGTTLHGIERKVDVRPFLPLSYYAREGAVGDLFRAGLIERWAQKVGIVGLGCGTLAWYGREWQEFDFFEIDPAVVKIASNPDYFTYLSRSKAKINIILGDARVMLRNMPDNSYDLLIIDAYSSDSIPLHLVTLEAFSMYKRKLKPDGMLFLHLSNRFFKLGPVVSRILDDLQMTALEKKDNPKNYSIKYDWYDEMQLSKSNWMAASSEPERLKLLKTHGGWATPEINSAYSIWTDSYVNLFQVYNWR